MSGILRNELAGVKYSFGSVDTRPSAAIANKLLNAMPDDVRQKFEEYAGPHGMTALLMNYLTEKFHLSIEKSFEGIIADIDEFESEIAAEEFISQLELYPRGYYFTLRLPSSFVKGLRRASLPAMISEKVSIVASWHDEVENFPQVEKSKIYRLQTQNGVKALKQEFVHLHLGVEGLVKEEVHTETPTIALHALRAFLGLGLALRVFQSSYRSPISGNEIRIFDKAIMGGEPLSRIPLDRNDEEFFESIHTGVSFNFEAISNVLDHINGKHKSKNLVLAAKWYCESLANPDEVMSFMQAAIVVEVLLGSEKGEEIGLTDMLANRCAFMLATSTERREKLLNDFKKIYKTRSKIVHTGVSRLGVQEKEQLRLLRAICAKILEREAVLISNSSIPDGRPDI